MEKAYTKSNLERLTELRKKYDPNGVFFAYSDGLTANAS
ncbi:MAG: BBE domain-containing protein [Candidatus Bathyarchaeia archaeon]